MQKIHYFSYDVTFEVLDKINEHNNYLDDYDGVSYSFVNDDHMSSEFFSITKIVPQKIHYAKLFHLMIM